MEGHDSPKREVLVTPISQFVDPYRLLVEAVKDYAIYLIDPNGYVSTWNAGAEQIKGYSADEIIGCHFSCFYPPEDVARNLPQQRLEQAVAQGKVEDEGWRVKKDGTRYWANGVITPMFDDKGTVLGFSKVLRDLSEHHAKEQKIQEQQMILAGIIDTAMDGIITVDDTYRIIMFNRAAEAMFLCSTTEALGQPLDTFIPERFRTLHARLVHTFAQSEVGFRKMSNPRIIYGLRTNGEEFPLEATISQTTVNGRKQLTVILRDISYRQQSEIAIAERGKLQEQLSKLTEVFPGALFSFRRHPDGFYSMPFISAAVSDVFGVMADKIRDDAALIFEGIHPDDIEQVNQTIADSARLMTLWHHEFRFQHPGKGEIWLEAWSAPVSEPDGGILWHGMVVDATSRKQVEGTLRENQHYLKQLIECLPQIVWTSDENQKCTYISPQWCEYTGLSETEDIFNSWEKFIHPDDWAHMPHLHHAETEGRNLFDAQYRLRRADGVYRWFKVRAIPFRDQSGKIVKWIGTSTDIDDQKQTEAALRQWADAFENCAHGIAIGNPTTNRILACNPAFARMHQQTVEEIAGLPILEVYDPADHEYVKHCIAVADQLGQVQYEARMRRKDGSTFDTQLDVVSVRDEDGTLRYRVATIQDITERKRAERRLLAQGMISRILAEVDTLSEAAPEILQTLCVSENWDGGVIWEVDKKNHRLRCVEVWSKSDPSFAGLIDHAQTLTFGLNIGLPGKVWATGAPLRIEEIGQDPDFAWAHPALQAGIRSALAFPIIHQGEIVGVVEVLSREISDLDRPILTQLGILGSQIGQFLARKRAQEQVQRFVSGSPSVIFALKLEDTEWIPIWTSENIFDLTGYSADETNEPGWWARHIHPEDYDRVIETQSTLKKTNHLIVEYRFCRRDGTYFWVRDEKRVLFDSSNQPTEVVGSWSDVTERVRLEEQFRQSQKMEAIGQLAGGVAHDFNNLLTVIIGYSDLLLARFPASDPKRNTLIEIKHAGEKAAELTRQLLAFSRKQVLEPKILDVNDIVGNIEKMLRRLIGEDIVLTTLLPPHLSKVKVDPGQLEQVIINLAINARDAMPQGGQLIIETDTFEFDEAYCALRPGYNPGWYTQISMTDTGCGMNSEVKSHIFEPFFTTKEQGKGTGLGLATVFGIVKQSGGHIEVYSEMGFGTCFKIYLPAVDAGWVAEASGDHGESVESGAETILLVEDEDVVRTITRLALETFGYHVIEAQSGTQALELIKTLTTPVALLLTDVVMPEMNGRQLAEHLQPLFPELKVLFMSGYTNNTISQHGILGDQIAFIQKPFTPTLLAKKVREVLAETR
ncbi:MAG: PAS domain S-box protein [Acidobacteria bacterium]|nr:PAS domain S-box protein [Acidobacteriota bacterium]